MVSANEYSASEAPGGDDDGSASQTSKLSKVLETLLWLGIPIIVISAWLCGPHLVETIFSPSDPALFGDSFGTINALFSGLALAGVVIALLLQRRDLKLQSEQLKITQQEVSAQNSALALQSFESTLFQLLKLFGDVSRDLDRTGGGQGVIGMDRFTELGASLGKYYAEQDLNGAGDEAAIAEAYGRLYGEQRQGLGYYFRTLKVILLHVERTVLEGADKAPYHQIVRSQLSDSELVLLFYQCTCNGNTGEMSRLARAHGIFRGFPKSLLLDASHVSLPGSPLAL